MIENAAAIVKMNFKLATFDAMRFNYFSPNYQSAEEMIDAAMDAKMSEMTDDDIQTFALAIVDGSEVYFDMEKESFYVEY